MSNDIMDPALRRSIRTAVFSASMAALPLFSNAEPIVEKSSLNKRNAVSAVCFVAGVACLGFAVKELKKVSKKD